MRKMNRTELFAWLRFVLNPRGDLPVVSDWENVYEFADKQKIIGLCSPLDYNVRISADLLSVWMGSVLQIKQLNMVVNQRALEVCKLWEEAGFRCCVLKGQGNAEMYLDPSSRIPGDIDLWIDADEQPIRDFVIQQFPNVKDCFKHLKFPVFNDVEVDVHQTPLKFRHPLHHRRLQRWINQQKEEQFSNETKLTGTGFFIHVPTTKFNTVYQLGHIMIHLFDEGIGFRQLIDYYYVLKNVEGISQEERDAIVVTWKSLGMLRLASAIMWIESDVLGIPKRCLLTTPNQQLGKRILEDVLEGGNFGHYSVRQLYRHCRKILMRRASTILRLIRLSPCFPSEAVFWIMNRSIAMIKADLGGRVKSLRMMDLRQ